MSAAVQETVLDPQEQAGALAAALVLLGFTAVVCTDGDPEDPEDDLWSHPCIKVSGGEGQRVHVTEFVYAAPADPRRADALWMFVWASLEPVGRLDRVAAAAAEIARRLACPDADCPLCAASGCA